MKTRHGSEPLIDLRDVTLVRQGHLILDDIRWRMNCGEHWFLMGANGAGKTSLLEILMGYRWATRGEVRVLGRLYGKANLPELRKAFGFLAPWIKRRIYAGETAGEVIAAGMEAAVRILGPVRPDTAERIRELLDFFECSGLSERSFDSLSSGEQLKILMARTLIHDPAVLFLDEPFSHLDLGAKVRTCRLLEKISTAPSSPAVVLVTHSPEDILPFFTHGLLLKKGRVFAAGKKDDVLTSRNLSALFDCEIRLRESGGKFFAS